MEFNWLSNAVEEWPEDVPQLYANLDGKALSSFMDKEEYRRLCKLPRVVILPIASEKCPEVDRFFGIGLSRLLIRDLMLVRDLSIRGPEETPLLLKEEATEQHQIRNDDSIWVSGFSRVRRDSFGVELRIHRPGKKTCGTTIKDANFREFVTQCTTTIAKVIGGTLTDEVRKKWTTGRPGTVKTLVDMGQLLTRHKSAAEKSKAALKLWFRDKGFSVALHAVEDRSQPNLRSTLLQAFERDPYNAQLCYELFHTVWETEGYEPPALQFLRRAIELAPGHGKAHMCAPYAAHPEVNMLTHAHLGYKLQPGNPRAIDSYIQLLSEAGYPPKKLLKVARKGIKYDPYDPNNYHRMIDLFIDEGDYRNALKIAERLHGLFVPEIDERAWYCMEQNLRIRDRLLTGEYDPVAENVDVIHQLRDAVSDGESSVRLSSLSSLSTLSKRLV